MLPLIILPGTYLQHINMVNQFSFHQSSPSYEFRKIVLKWFILEHESIIVKRVCYRLKVLHYLSIIVLFITHQHSEYFFRNFFLSFEGRYFDRKCLLHPFIEFKICLAILTFCNNISVDGKHFGKCNSTRPVASIAHYFLPMISEYFVLSMIIS